MDDEKERAKEDPRWILRYLYNVGPTVISIVTYLWAKNLEAKSGIPVGPYAMFWLAGCLALAAGALIAIHATTLPPEGRQPREERSRRLIHASAIIHIVTTAAFLLRQLSG